MLPSMGSQRVRHNLVTEQQQILIGLVMKSTFKVNIPKFPDSKEIKGFKYFLKKISSRNKLRRVLRIHVHIM